MFRKTVPAILALALALAFAPGVSASEPFEVVHIPRNYDEAIVMFYDDLQSGFRAIWSALGAMGHPEPRSVDILNIYLGLDFIRENIMGTPLVQIPFPNNEDVTYAEFYPEFLARMLANTIHIMPAIIVLGNPHGTDWDDWFDFIMADFF